MSTSPERRETTTTAGMASARPRENKEVAQVVSGGSIAKAPQRSRAR